MVPPTPRRIVWRLTLAAARRGLTKHAVLLVGGLELAPRPGIFAMLGFRGLDVPLIGCKPARVLDPGQRLVD